MESKGMMRSMTMIGGILAFVPLAEQLVQQILAANVLPPKAAAAVAGVGGLLAMLGRLRARLPIKGIL